MSFKNILGHQAVIERIRSSIDNNRLAAAYLFIGQDGVGKFLTAKTLSKAINCQDDNSDSCDKCSSCLRIEKNQHPDVQVLDFENADIKIEYIRQLQKDASLRPYEARKKVFIINNAHKLNHESSNAFLKTLEEPPKSSLIILVSSKPQLILATILSRCQTLKFYPFPRRELELFLNKDYSIENNLAHFLAYYTEGSLGEAIKFKDKDMLSRKNRIIDAISSGGVKHSRSQEFKTRDELYFALNILSSWFRDIYLAKIQGVSSDIINLDRKNELERIASRYSFIKLDNIFKTISESLFYTESNVNIKLLILNLKISLEN
ncbi:MAG: DNA polymerase III subunit delta' [Candidatus Omnitrophota bacterium]